jgi:hypothetical protein
VNVGQYFVVVFIERVSKCERPAAGTPCYGPYRVKVLGVQND